MKGNIITLVYDNVDDIDAKGVPKPGRRHSSRTTPFGKKHLPIEPYHHLTDVPVPLRHTIRRAHESGLTIEHLVKIFDLPAEWVQRFVADPGLD